MRGLNVRDRLSPAGYINVVGICLLALFGLVWLYTETQQPRYMPSPFGIAKAQTQLVDTCNLGKVVILGSSRANSGLIPKILGLDAKNIAMRGATPIDAYYEASRIYKCRNPPAIFLLSFSGYDFEHTTWFWAHSANWILDFDDLQGVSKEEQLLGDHTLYNSQFGSEPPPMMKDWYYSSKFPPYEFPSLLAAKIGNWRKRVNDQISKETLAADGQHLLGDASCAQQPGRDALDQSFIPHPLNKNYFDRLIKLLSAHGASIFFVSPPLSKSTFNGLHRNYELEYTEFLRSTEKQNPSLRIVGPIFPELGNCGFSDPNHVNRKGAIAYSRMAGPWILDALAHQDATRTLKKFAEGSLPQG